MALPTEEEQREVDAVAQAVIAGDPAAPAQLRTLREQGRFPLVRTILSSRTTHIQTAQGTALCGDRFEEALTWDLRRRRPRCKRCSNRAAALAGYFFW